MAHPEQRQFFESVKARFPEAFKNVKAVDLGSLDVNGSLRDMFEESEYLGVDIVQGRNVDLVSFIDELPFKEEFDTVVSGECLEHSSRWPKDLAKMYEMCKVGGLIAISAASDPRPVHGVRSLGAVWGTEPDYYHNISEEDVRSVWSDDQFEFLEITFDKVHGDIYVLGRKK